jgi:hypothetical protein
MWKLNRRSSQRANLTVLEDNPLTVDAMKIKDIRVWGTVMEGRKLPAVDTAKKASLEPPQSDPAEQESEFTRAALGHALKVAHALAEWRSRRSSRRTSAPTTECPLVALSRHAESGE